MFIIYTLYFNWVCWVLGNFSGEPGHIYVSCVCLRLWGAGPVRVYLGIVVVWTAGLYGFSSLWLCSGGYSTGEMVRGGGSVFPLLFLVCCQFSWRLDICGRNFVLYIF